MEEELTLNMSDSNSSEDYANQCLTKREVEVCNLAKNGFSDQEIAACLLLSHHTVKNHTKNIYRKLGVNTRARLVARLHNSK